MRTSTAFTLSATAVAGALAGCGAPQHGAPPRAVPAQERLPALVVAHRNTVLFGKGPSRARIGSAGAGVVRLVPRPSPADDARDDAVAVTVQGSTVVDAYVRRADLDVLVCEPGFVGEHLFATRGDRLQLRGFAPPTRFGVHAAVTMGVFPSEGRRYAVEQVAIDGDVDEARLCTELPRREATTGTTVVAMPGHVVRDDFPSGTTILHAGKDVPLELLDRPDGTAIVRRPAGRWSGTLAVLREEGGWIRVAVGSRPYAVGWMRPCTGCEVEPPPDGSAPDLVGGLVGGSIPGAWTLHVANLRNLPLHELAAGAVIVTRDGSRAVLARSGHARVGARVGGRAGVVAAADSDVTVEGWVDEAQLGAVVRDP